MATCVESLLGVATAADGLSTELDLQASTREHEQRTILQWFQGVPKPALCGIFGERLGERIWGELNLADGCGRTKIHSPDSAEVTRSNAVTDCELIGGMLEHLSKRAAQALRDAGKRATELTLSTNRQDGSSSQLLLRLSRATDLEQDLMAAGRHWFIVETVEGAAIASLNLSVTGFETQIALAEARALAATSMAAGPRVEAWLRRVLQRALSRPLKWCEMWHAVIPMRHHVRQS